MNRTTRLVCGSLFGLVACALLARPATGAPGDISTVAGGGVGDGGTATAATTYAPYGVTTDAAGNLYIADTYNNRVRKVDTGGTITTVAGNGLATFGGDGGPATAASLHYPTSVALDGAGNLYIADLYNHRIRKVNGSGTITTVAGTGTAGYLGDGGAATAARINYPYGVWVDGAGVLYIADTRNNRVRKVSAGGTIATVAGTGTAGYLGDGGPATAARLYYPYGVAVDGGGNLWIADTYNHRVRVVNTGGTISTAAGTGTGGFSGDGGAASLAQLNYPTGVLDDGAGNLYIADYTNNRIRQIDSGGTISTVAGTGTAGFFGDGGAATAAELNAPVTVALDAGGNLYVADSANNRVRQIDTGGTIATVAGNGTTSDCGDGGAATAAAMSYPNGVAVDGAGNLFVADTNNHRVRKVDGAGTITTVAGSGTPGYTGDGGAATAATLDTPYAVAVDGMGNLYVAEYGNDVIRKVDSGGTISTMAGNGSPGFSGDGGAATAAQLANPTGVILDGGGNLYIVDSYNQRVRMVDPGGTITTVAGDGNMGFAGDGGPATAGRFSSPRGIAIDGAGNLYVADYTNNRVRMIDTGGTISTVAGAGAKSFSGDGGAATAATFHYPSGVAIDGAGNLYIADNSNQRVRMVTTYGTIATVAGSGTGGFAGDGGPAVAARLLYPYGVAATTGGDVYVADTNNSRLRKVESPAGLPLTTASPPGGPYSAAQSVTLSCVATAGCTATSYCTGSGCTPTTPYGGAIPIAATTTVRFFSVDALGNTEPVRTHPYVIDVTPPVTTASASGYTFGNWTKTGTVNVTLSATDTGGTGVAAGYPQYCVDTTNTCTPATSYSGAIAMTCAAGSVCDRYVRFAAVDVAGNVETTKSVRVRQDLQAPTTSPSLPGGSYNGQQTVSLACADGAGAGCLQTLYCLGGSCTPGTAYAGALNFVASTTLRYASTDAIANAEAVQESVYDITYTVTPSAGANGAIDPATPQAVAYTAVMSFTITPDAGYKIDTVGGCGGALLGDGVTYETAPVTADCAVTVSFKGDDGVPYPFAFPSRSNVPLSTLVVSDAATIAGITIPVAIDVAGGEYSVNNGPFTAVSGTVTNGDSVRVRLTSAATYTTTTAATLTVGGVNAAFTVTTVAATPPFAMFGYTIGADGLTVNVSATGSYCVSGDCAYDWVFGDSGTGAGFAASHTYGAGGYYAITLTVTDNANSLEAAKTVTVRVVAIDQRPTASSASFVFNANTWTATLVDASTDDHGISRVVVNWGDGTVVSVGGMGDTFTHRYAMPGSFVITHKAIDTIGQEANELPAPTAAPAYFTLDGTVYRSDGLTTVPSAVVRVTAPGLTRTLYSTSNGTYRATNLKPGTYTVTVSKSGFVFPTPAPTATLGPNATVNVVAVTP